MPVIAATELSDTETQAINDIMDFRMTLTSCKTNEEALSEIDLYEKNLVQTDAYSLFTNETKLILDNFINLERYNYYVEIDLKHPKLEPLITPQYNKNVEWFKSNNEKDTNKWLHSTFGDVISCTMQFMSTTKAMSAGLVIKKHYEFALEQDPDFCYGLSSMGQWLFQAPGFAGGSKKKALQHFEKAVERANTDAEQFYAKIYLSQMYFDREENDKANNLLADADELQPNSNYVEKMRKINKTGHSLYTYYLNREKIDKEIKNTI